jgi:hypothetical protein
VNAPEQAAAQAEMLTRDADDPAEASGESIAPPPPSRLAALTLGVGAAATNGTAAAAAPVNGVTAKLAGLMSRGANVRAVAPAAARGAAV